MARPSMRTPERQERFLAALAEGKRLAAAAREIGVDPRTLHYWRDDDEAFAAAWDATLRRRRAERRRSARRAPPPRSAFAAACDPACRLFQLFPDTGPLRRELYRKHLEFFRLGAASRERLFLAANRVGKTEGAGGYETVLHLTGLYPDWWEGRRFDRPVRALIAGETAKTVRDIVQRKLFGPPGGRGTGLLPAATIVATNAKAGAAGAVDTARIRHAGGGESLLIFRSFDQGREAFQGDEQDVVWLDEEPPLDVYTECLVRTMTTGGFVMLTFTPLNGWTDVVRLFLETPQPAATESRSALP